MHLSWRRKFLDVNKPFSWTQWNLKVKSYHLLRSVRITRFLANETFSGNSCVFWCVLKLQSLMVFIFELHQVSNDFIATCHKCNQPNHNNWSNFPLLILEKLFLRTVSLSLFIFWWQRCFFIKTHLVASGELAIIFCFQTFNYYALYSQNGQSNICTSSTIVICSDDRLTLKTLALETFYNSQFT